MSHLTEEQMVDAYYSGDAAAERGHLLECPECRARLDQLAEALEAFRDYPVPERNEAYGREVFRRLEPHLGASGERRSRFQWWPRIWMLAPALAVLLAVAFLAGIWTERKETAGLLRTRERVLLIAMSDHLERSQVVLSELVHAGDSSPQFPDERERARDLLDENRLLRQTAAHLGDRSHAALLDELERVLLDMANGPARRSPAEMQTLQRRIEQDGLLWKVRITSSNAREKGQKL